MLVWSQCKEFESSPISERPSLIDFNGCPFTSMVMFAVHALFVFTKVTPYSVKSMEESHIFERPSPIDSDGVKPDLCKNNNSCTACITTDMNGHPDV